MTGQGKKTRKRICWLQCENQLDGIEVYNGNLDWGQDPKDIKDILSRHPDYIRISASDLHQPCHKARGGIVLGRWEDCFIYAIEHEGKTLLYGHDSAMLGEETWQGLRRFFDCVVLDCTMVERVNVFKEHMGFPDNIKIRERMLREGMAREDTLFVATHFVHTFNPIHERITPIFREHGFVAAYDGLDIEF